MTSVDIQIMSSMSIHLTMVMRYINIIKHKLYYKWTMPVTSCINGTCMFEIIYPDLISEVRRIVRACDRQNNEPVTLRKYATK